ncbi:MAG: hypothetical protein QXJ17_04405 [Nitrososphaeria archaeon]
MPEEEQGAYARVEGVFGFERMLSNIVNGRIEDAYKIAAMLANELNIPSPYPSLEKYQIASHVLNARTPYFLKADVLKSLGLDPTLTFEENVKLLYRMKYEALRSLFVFMNRARILFEDSFGIPLHKLLNPQTVDTLIYTSTGAIAEVGSMQPDFVNSVILTIYSIICGTGIKQCLKLLKYSLLHECFIWLSKHGPLLRRSRYAAVGIKYEMLFSRMRSEVHAQLDPHVRTLGGEESLRHIEYVLPEEWLTSVSKRFPAPFLVVERRAWATGIPVANGTVNLQHQHFPWRAEANRPLLATILATTGSGKTTLLNSLAFYMLERGSFGLRLEIDVDDRMQGQLMALPLDEKHPAFESLKSQGCSPRGFVVRTPTSTEPEITKHAMNPSIVSLMVVKNRRELQELMTKPTKLDRLLFVRNHAAFHIPWDRMHKEGRLICLRFHSERNTGTVFSTLLKSFALWRMTRKDMPVFVQIDEAYLGAASRVSARYGRTYLRSAEQTEVFMRGARGLGIPTFLSTQRPYFVTAGARSQVSHIFSSYLGEGRDIDAVLEKLPPKSVDVNVVDTFLKRSEIRSKPYFWFLWLNLLDSEVKVVRPMMPPCGAEMPNMTAWDQFAKHGLAFESWDEVPTLFQDVGTEDNPLPLYEPFLPEKEVEKLLDRRRKGTLYMAEKQEEIDIQNEDVESEPKESEHESEVEGFSF